MTGHQRDNAGDIELGGNSWLPAAPAEGKQLRALTLNCWGLWVVAKQRQQRIRAIAKYLERTNAEVVVLQEVFLRADADTLISGGARGGLPYSQRFRGGILGGELVTLSRHPIIAVHFEQFRASGNPVAILQGDYFAGKGIGHTRIATPHGTVDVYNTHTHANYSHRYKPQQVGQPWRVPADRDSPIRLAQIAQLAQFIKLTAGQNVLVGGDMNAPPDSLDIALFRSLLPSLRDPWAELHPEDPGHTSNSPNNTLAAGSKDPPVRIDYLWTSAKPLAATLFSKKTSDGTSFSDHMGLAAVIGLPHSAAKQADEGWAVAEEAPLAVTADIILQGCRRYNAWKDACLAASATLLAVGLLALGFVIPQPWWRYPGGLLVVLAIIQALALAAAPLLFIIGMAGLGSVGHALEQAADELQLLLPPQG